MTKTATVIGDIYDAWRTQDVEWLASYLPEDFHHVIHIPAEVHPLGGMRLGKSATLDRLSSSRFSSTSCASTRAT